MTSTLEHSIHRRLVQVLVAAALAAIFVLATAGLASADGNYGGSSNYPTNPPPARTQAPPATPAASTSGGGSSLPITGGDALGLAALGLGVVGVGAGLVTWSRRRSVSPAGA